MARFKDIEEVPLLAEIEMPVAAPVVVPQIRVEPRISFDVWFMCKERSAASMMEPHHKVGMHAFASIQGKKTKAEWDRAFASY